MTYSVVMRDPTTGAFGVAVQSHWFNVGSVVPWVRTGVGAVATQSLAEPMYGPRGLDLMAEGKTAVEALTQLLGEDETPEVRQVAMIDASGNVAAHTGDQCIAFASHVTGEGWSVQANIMRTDQVVPAMAEAAQSSSGDLPDRMLRVLVAAERTGGDLRGSQSAALLVSDDGPVPAVTLRVEDHPDPITELTRLLEIRDMYDDMEAGDEALGAGETEAAAAAYDRAARSPHAHAEVLFWQAHGLATVGDHDRALEVMREALAANPDLRELLDRLPAAGLMDEDAAGKLEAEL